MLTYKDFNEFYEHPFIKSIAHKKRWSVSDKNKVPIDMYALEHENKICGAQYRDERCLVDLEHLCNFLPNAANNAFYLDALVDGIVVLDIEPVCPEPIKNQLLELPYLYGERSMSGQGYHLFFKLPDLIINYPAAQKKTAMKEKHRYYEILMNHWVTFTRDMLPDSTATNNDFEALFEDLAKQQVEVDKKNIDIEALNPDDIPLGHEIINILMNQEYKKEPEDFYHDMSTYEYGHMGFLYQKLKQLLNVSKFKKQHNYSDNERTWLLYLTAQEVIPYRSKHDEFRDNLPWLLYLAKDLISKDLPTG